MNIKKIVSVVTAATTIFTMAGPAFGVTAEELLQQIQQLQQQLNQLMQQYQQLTGQQPSAGVPAACQGVTFTRDLKLGMSGNDVKCLQALLNQDPETKIADTGAGSPGNETTYFGPKTKAAVIKFQEKYKDEILTPAGLTKGTGYVGAKTRTKLNALLEGGVVVTPPPSAPAFEPMKVKVAEDTPVTANIQKGTPNNPVLKIVLSGSETEAVNVSGITLTQYGNALDAAVTAVRLWDENGVQLGSDRTLIGGRAIFVLVPTLQIPVKGTRTITVTVDVASGADTLTTVQLGVNAATDITGAAFTGNFPLKGNVFTIVPAGQYGSLSVGSYGALPKLNVKIGERDVVLNRFIVSAGAREDVTLKQLTIEGTSNHTAVDTDITNIRIREVGGSVVGGPVNLSAKKATINLVSGVTITKGTSKRFELVADIVSGNGRNLDIVVRANKVIGVGVTSGISIVATGSDADFPTVSIGIGTLTVTQSANHPVGTAANYVKTTVAKTIGVFKLTATGEDILMNQVRLTFGGLGNADELRSVGLYDGDSLISNLVDSITTSTATTNFTLNWTIPANTSKDLTVKAVTVGIVSSSQTITVTWNAPATGFNGYGLASGEGISFTSSVALSGVTIYSSGDISVFALDDTKTNYNQGVLAPLSDVLLSAFKVRVTREDMRLAGLRLFASTSTTAGATTTASSTAVSEVALYDVDGNQLTKTVSVGTSGANLGMFVIEPEDILQEVVFTKDTYKTILVKGRVAATTSDWYLLEAKSLVLEGVESTGTTSKATALANSNQGNYRLSSLVVEMKKNASSPSGNVSRGSAETYAIWDVTNPTGSAAPITSITFTSKTGLPSGVGTSTSYFKLYDELGNSWTATAASSTAGTVTFGSISGLSVPAGSTKTLYLKINTTDTSVWPSNTTMHWTVASVGDVLVTGGYVGYAGIVWSIPADTNVVRLP
jgi:peptidoglycan hydrolase-like protein with peptidoglycan-binding domain